jgi:hypothetical protein
MVGVAQLVERQVVVLDVVGSSPIAHPHVKPQVSGLLPDSVAWRAGRRASVSVDGTVLAGSLEPRAMQFVQEWAKLHREEILANWDRARRSQPLLAIPPLP